LADISRILCNTILLVIIFAGIVTAGDSGDFNFRAGLGYDFVSQEYFLNSSRYDTSLTPDPDLTDNTLLKKDYLDDAKGLFYIKYEPGDEDRFRIEAGWEQTPENFRARTWGQAVLGEIGNRFEADFNLERKDRYRGTSGAGEDLSVLGGNIRYRRSLSETLESHIRFYGENINFDSLGSLVYNYSRYGGELGLNILTRGFNSLYITAGLEGRTVPDSTRLGYTAAKGTIGYLGYLSGSQIMGDISVENKKYRMEENQDDYFLMTLTSSLRIPITSSYFIKPAGDMEFFNFSEESYLNDDYVLARLALLLERDFNNITFYIGPKFELYSIAADYESDDDYLEYSAFTGLDFFQTSRIFLMLENQVGQRQYGNNPIYYSDFIFDRASVIGSAKIWAGLSLDVLFSAEWEWHKIESDDSRLYLLSSGISYKF